MLRFIFFVFFLNVFTSCLTLNILGLFPYPGKSHFNVFQPFLKELTSRGHNLTVVSYFPQKKPMEKYTDIVLSGDLMADSVDLQDLPGPKILQYSAPIILADTSKYSCRGLKSNRIQELLNSEQKFDLIITEFFNSDCFLGFVHKFKVPFIGLSSCTIMHWSNARFGNPANPSYIPVSFLPYSDRMSFLERVENTILYVFIEIMFPYLTEAFENAEAKKFFGEDLPPLADIARNASLMLVNSHFSLNLPRPLVNNIIEVGGFHLEKPKQLPEHLEKFINDSPHGVIYFSMGSLVKSQTFSVEKRNMLVNTFAKLKQRVLWRWDNETLPNKPENVMIQSWLPQYDILCHPNVVAFIGHGGLLGVTEAVQCGVPMVLFPQFGDQFTNAKAVETVGAGVFMYFADVSEETLSATLNIILQPNFKRQAEEVSRRFRDRPMSPMDTAVYWVEYVGKHGGAHMQSQAANLPLYQLLLLDVIAFLISVFIFAITVTYFTIRWLWKLLFSKKKLKIQ